MGRKEGCIKAEHEAVAELASQLRKLRAAAGEPTYRSMAAQTHCRAWMSYLPMRGPAAEITRNGRNDGSGPTPRSSRREKSAALQSPYQPRSENLIGRR